ncbi:cytoskeletal protein CcmA (bactofilin family) [Herbaspirillum sp. Sphag1AN]|uniref:bactofilin family protein n=1 Tax=unclassified Herbaspirillum TaxID=2624150 RepID=UPI001622E094|nr:MULTISPECIES: polymer-forming cytoskeletal protein [unclassified Herbaspirillum]MBB3214592.1 cytoskeletal protein CcmA (bactofilin family) [Herbaspirillum sp. Sphag1AN]MBB3247738.1 cytoskeletal protein CcmA (bactofilin family) [Herbaspirillum sp. Sphag64]
MLGRKSKSTIDSLIGASTNIQGDVNFKGGLRIDGQIKGNINAEQGQPSVLVISEHAKIIGEIRAVHVIVNGEIVGDVHSVELLELQPKARITGNVYYKALEMHGGALVSGKLSHDQNEELPLLKLAVSSGDA